ncbi:MAG: CDP-alcohol phosphatidyltransferase family protein [Candidatus Nanopelagicales bacterium]|nr:CDP-alcohol phosphatidyltransferase family protein [Candidatus Nanopelagicales bacterium]MDZ4250028.1 CDP-alcohol phosphatidyltransferase family protein [Candidatus Nanopelagicales bacterium]MDZ7578711.1 CDP-alcohol phosphatidyltransferase family protein [Candidatus Nanopelagicales bacterium]
MKIQETRVQTDRVFTIPNILSFLRLLGIPVLLWLILVPKADGWAFALLAVSGITDWADGKIARATGQISRLGQILDPVADRAYIAATLIALALRGLVPWWLVLVLLGRDLVLAALLPALKRRGVLGLPVHFLGKAATFCLLYAFPLILLGAIGGTVGEIAKVVGWASVLWGTGLYLYAAVLYMEQASRVIRTRPVGMS